jgi:hypothetical protein
MTNLTTPFTRWKNGFLVGAVVAALEGALLWTADPGATFWVLVQGISFWLFCGLVIYLTETGLPDILNGILLTVLLNIPWYIALSVTSGKPGNLIPLLIASLFFGALIGWMSQRLKRK